MDTQRELAEEVVLRADLNRVAGLPDLRGTERAAAYLLLGKELVVARSSNMNLRCMGRQALGSRMYGSALPKATDVPEGEE